MNDRDDRDVGFLDLDEQGSGDKASVAPTSR